MSTTGHEPRKGKGTVVHHLGRLAAATVAIILFGIGLTVAAQASVPAVKLIPSGKLGTNLSNPEGVGVAADGSVYVADRDNHRVQKFDGAGNFVLMFGRDVNETTGGDVCTASSGDVCKPGAAGAGTGAFNEVKSIAVDTGSGNVYVEDLPNWRTDEYTADGEFVLMIGRHVDATTGGNLCTAESKDACQAGERGPSGGTEGGSFRFTQSDSLLAAGGPSDLLYVGDERRVQKFEANGTYKGELSLSSLSSEPESNVVALAVDSAGDIYLVYRVKFVAEIVHEFNAAGTELQSFRATNAKEKPGEIKEGEGTVQVQVDGLALDGSGHLAVTGYRLVHRSSGQNEAGPFGTLYDARNGSIVSGFDGAGTSSLPAIAFDRAGSLYAPIGNEITVYSAEPIAELTTGFAECQAGLDMESDATDDCTFSGTIDPNGVSQTEAFFEWGEALALESKTSRIPVGTANEPVPFEATVNAIPPHQEVFYRSAGYDLTVPPGEEALTAPTIASTTTAAVPPRVIGEPHVSFVTASSAVMSAKLNPENADTTYSFQYGACPALDSCAGLSETKSLKAAMYGEIGTTLEAGSLRQGTSYRYRLVAKSVGGETKGPEAEVRTAEAPKPQAITGGADAVGPTSAIISGVVNPDGQAAGYSFELGVYADGETQFGVVVSGSAGEGASPVTERVALTGLQPGTVYAYRITASSGYGVAAGAIATFTTAGAPLVIGLPVPPVMLALPKISFPKAVTGCKRGYRRAGKNGRKVVHRNGGRPARGRGKRTG
jgi:NHL repeat-containing protein